jgi:S-DNA-T family DNA segregation ATPase FtsK/SpoIIIE
MNVVVPNKPEPAAPRVQDPASLVAKVAIARLRKAMDASPNTKCLFNIVGMDKALACAVARIIAAQVENSFVRVHTELDDGTLPEELQTIQNTTDFRNMDRGKGGGCIVFATPTRDLDIVGATAGEISPLSFDALAVKTDLWIDASLELASLTPRQRGDVRNFTLGLHKSGIVTGGLQMLAEFFIALDRNFRDQQIERAIDESLATLRIFRQAGRFKESAKKGKLRSPERWAELLRDLQKKTDDAVHLVNDRGVELDRNTVNGQIDTLVKSGRLDEDEAALLRNLVNDTGIEQGIEWRSSQKSVIELSWEKVEPVFKTPKKVSKETLGEQTQAFFKNNYPDALNKAEKQQLKAISGDDDEPDDEEREFFFQHRTEIADDKRLLKRWESYIFPRPIEHADILSGILSTIAELVRDAEKLPDSPRILVRLVGGNKLPYWKNKNAELATYLRDRYRGLDTVMLTAGVVIDFGMLWSSDWSEQISGSPKTGPTARQFKIDVYLLDATDFDAEGKPSDTAMKSAASRHLIWSMPTTSLASSYTENLEEILAAKERPLPIGRFSRAQRSERVVEEGIDLENRGSIQDAHGQPDGILIDTNVPSLDAAWLFMDGIKHVENFISAGTCNRLVEALNAFRENYSEAVQAMISGGGLASPVLFEQAQRYGDLLDQLRRDARKDECRKRLWEPLLLVGMALSDDKPEAAIITPWHPFRLAEAAAKAKRVAAAVKRLLSPDDFEDDAIRKFASGVMAGISVPWHPAVAIRTDGPTCHMLIESDAYCDFSLLEPPVSGEGREAAFDGYAREAAAELITIANEYLNLQPHERANFSVSLFNADNRDLPSRLAERLARKIETEADLRCDLILTHTDQQRLRQIYAEQNVAISRELDGALAGEATKTFLSRLRVGFLDADSVGKAAEGRSRVDIVFLHDVIARSAKLAWRRVDPVHDTFADFCDPEGEASSRKRPFETGARKTEVFLVPNERPVEVQNYLNLVHDLHVDEQEEKELQFAPVREIVFDDTGVGQTIEKAHQVGNWVVTFDAIADRQLLVNNGVNIIRFLPKPSLHHNVIVSTKRHERTLTGRLTELIGPIADLGPAENTDAAAKFIEDAATVSGKVVMHAARNENNANELVGLVLSKHLVKKALNSSSKPVAWLLIDDFVDRMGHPAGKRADILVVSLSEEEGRPLVDLVVIESKFVRSNAEPTEARDAVSQLKATTDHIRDNFVLDKDPLNRPTWLSRLADLIAEQGTFDEVIGGLDASAWSNHLRTDSAILRVRGVALIFSHDRRDGVAEPFPTASDEQEEFIFDRHQIAALINEFRGGASTSIGISLPTPASSDGSSGRENVVVLRDSAKAQAPSTVETPPTVGNLRAEEEQAKAVESPSNAASTSREGRLPPPVMDYIREHAAEEADPLAESWLEDTQMKLRRALRGYNLDSEVLGARLTPNAALIRFRGSDRLTVAAVEAKQDVLLTSHALDVVGVRPEKGEVVVMVARDQRAVRGLSELWLRRTFDDAAPQENSSFLLGERESDGSLLHLNLAHDFGGQPQHGPHTLIAGETGSGKGVLTRNLILDICATNSPNHARLMMIDPKGGADYPWIGSMPHFEGELITDREAAVDSFKRLVDEMERRLAVMNSVVASKIESYNTKVSSEKRLPRIYFFHDEIGEWMADKDNKEYPKAVMNYLARLGMKARSAGIHVFLITQRPDKDAVPGPIKANMNNKICLRVSNQANSRIVLDENGAERLLGNGHFVAKLANERPSNQNSLIYAQTPFLDEDDAGDLAAVIRSYWTNG